MPPQEQNGNVPPHADGFGKVPNPAEPFGSIPKSSEPFGNVPKHSEDFRIVRNDTERTEQHTLTVREAARLFEQAGVPRTERSIVNWCQPNHQGIARLDAFFDTNERKYFITPQSVELAIKEEQAKQSTNAQVSASQETPEPIRKHAETNAVDSENAAPEIQNKLRDLEITNRVKDQVIAMMEKERARLLGERENHVHELMTQSHRIGQLETEVKQLGAPKNPLLAEPGVE